METLIKTHHWETLTFKTHELLEKVTKLPFISEFYLAGGTGLALQIGHRFSVDLDFFSDSSQAVGADQRKTILNILLDDPSLTITWDKDGTFVAHWYGVGVSFFRLDQHPLVKPSFTVGDLRVATVAEIGAMKLAAILARGTRKDYVDLYFILQQTTLSDLFEIAAVKYPYNKAFPSFSVRALAYFDDVESDPMPRMITSVNWTTIKSFLEKQAIDIGRKLLELEKLWSLK